MAFDDETVSGPAALGSLDGELRDLARHAPSPFLTPEWLRAWWDAFGAGEALAVTVRSGGEPVAAAFCARHRGGLDAAANDHTGDWDVVAVDPAARQAAWRALARLRPGRVRLSGLPEWSGGADAAEAVLRDAGYRVVRERGPLSPFLPLPGSFEELLAGRSRNLRSQVGRRRRALEQEGELVFRTSRTPADVERDLGALLAVEASGWKGRDGTAIAADPRTEQLYRRFATAAARGGWARVHLLELDGRPLAGDLEVVRDGVAYLVKTGYDEAWGRMSPGLVLRAAVLRHAVEEGLHGYDFLGGPDAYKTRWTDEVRARVRLHAFRHAPGYWYRAHGRPALKRLRARVRPEGG